MPRVFVLSVSLRASLAYLQSPLICFFIMHSEGNGKDKTRTIELILALVNNAVSKLCVAECELKKCLQASCNSGLLAFCSPS